MRYKLLFFSFLAYVLIGLFGNSIYINSHNSNNAGTFVTEGLPTTQLPTNLSIEYLIFVIIGIFVTTFLMLRYGKYIKQHIFKIWWLSFWCVFLLAIYFMINELIALFAPNFYDYLSKAGYTLIFIPIVFSITIFIYMRKNTFFNFITFVITIFYAIILGFTLPPMITFIFLGILSVYDYIAVFVTKHMQKLVMVFGGELLPMMFIDGDVSLLKEKMENIGGGHFYCKNCGYGPMKEWTKRGLSYFSCTICKREGYFNDKDKKKSIIIVNGSKDYRDNPDWVDFSKRNPSVLGGGDIIVPGSIIASLAFLNSQLWIFAVLGACFGMGMNMLWIAKNKRAIPALPMIAIFITLFIGLGLEFL